MAQTVSFKDPVSGNVQTLQFDNAYPVEITVPNDNTEWTLITTDPSESVETEHEGARPKR